MHKLRLWRSSWIVDIVAIAWRIVANNEDIVSDIFFEAARDPSLEEVDASEIIAVEVTAIH